MLVLLCTISSFIFYGNFKMNLDDNKTKELDTSIFINMDDTRLLAKKNDSSVITDDILKQAKSKTSSPGYVAGLNGIMHGERSGEVQCMASVGQEVGVVTTVAGQSSQWGGRQNP